MMRKDAIQANAMYRDEPVGFETRTKERKMLQRTALDRWSE